MQGCKRVQALNGHFDFSVDYTVTRQRRAAMHHTVHNQRNVVKTVFLQERTQLHGRALAVMARIVRVGDPFGPGRECRKADGGASRIDREQSHTKSAAVASLALGTYALTGTNPVSCLLHSRPQLFD